MCCAPHFCPVCGDNVAISLVLNVIKSQRRYNDKTAILLQALVCVLCRLVKTAVGFLKMVVASAGTLLPLISVQLRYNSSSCATKVPTLLELRKFLKT